MDEKSVSILTMESAMMHLQEANRRLARITMIALTLMFVMFGCFMYFLTNYEISTEEVTVDSKSGPANYIGNDGEINNGVSESEEDNN